MTKEIKRDLQLQMRLEARKRGFSVWETGLFVIAPYEGDEVFRESYPDEDLIATTISCREKGDSYIVLGNFFKGNFPDLSNEGIRKEVARDLVGTLLREMELL